VHRVGPPRRTPRPAPAQDRRRGGHPAAHASALHAVVRACRGGLGTRRLRLLSHHDADMGSPNRTDASATTSAHSGDQSTGGTSTVVVDLVASIRSRGQRAYPAARIDMRCSDGSSTFSSPGRRDDLPASRKAALQETRVMELANPIAKVGLGSVRSRERRDGGRRIRVERELLVHT